MFGRWRYFAGALGLLLCTLALAGRIDGGWLLLRWDEPVQRIVENARTSDVTAVVKRISFLGSTVAVLTLGTVLASHLVVPLSCRRHGCARRHLQPAVARVHDQGARRPRSTGPRTAGQRDRTVVPERARDGRRRALRAGAARRHPVHAEPADLVGDDDHVGAVDRRHRGEPGRTSACTGCPTSSPDSSSAPSSCAAPSGCWRGSTAAAPAPHATRRGLTNTSAMT